MPNDFFILPYYLLVSIATILAAYGGVLFFAGRTFRSKPRSSHDLPFISLLIAAKNEEKYIDSVIEELSEQDYPEDRYEIIICEDGSHDSTRDIAKRWVGRYPRKIKLTSSEISIGKPSALNRGLVVSSGEIIGVIDADSSVEKNLLRNVARIFEPEVKAIQGEPSVKNKGNGLLTKLTTYEQEVWNRYLIRGRARLGLFVPCIGNLSFVRRSVLEEVGGWDRNALAEDIELALSIWLKGHRFEYHPEVKCKEMTVSKLKSFYSQRLRWYSGFLQSFIRHGNLLRKLSAQAIDGEILLATPLLGVIGLAILAMGAISVAAGMNVTQVAAFAPFTIGAYTIFSSVASLAVVRIDGEKNAWKLIPAIYVYWGMESVISSIALLKVLTRRRIAWQRTEK